MDYKEVLSPADFAVFAKLRDWRKATSQSDGIPVYAVLTNEQLAAIATHRPSTPAQVQAIEGIGEAKAGNHAAGVFAILRQDGGPTSVSAATETADGAGNGRHGGRPSSGRDETEHRPCEKMAYRAIAPSISEKERWRADLRVGRESMTADRQPQRRRPAHHPPIERFNEPVIVQVNICTKNRRPLLACADVHRLCADAWSAADFWRVGRYVIMPDHIHLFCIPGRVPMPSLKHWVEYWKGRIATQWPQPPEPGGPTSVSAAKVDRRGTDGTEAVPPGRGMSQAVRFKLWQRDCWDTQMRSREHYEEKLAYVRMNPVRKGLARTPDDWPYQGQVFPIAWE